MSSIRDMYEKQAQAALAKLAQIDALPDFAEMPEGTVLLFRRCFQPEGRTYTYTALKAGSRYGRPVWYITGNRNPNQTYTDEDMVNTLSDMGSLVEISIVTEWEILFGTGE